LIGKSEALFRNCDGSNVVINDLVGADARLGIVDSTFEPSVYPTFALRPPEDKCGVPMAGLPPICDPRAQCIAKASGIACACKENGLSEKGAINGTSCTRNTTLEASLSSPQVQLTIPKPGSKSLLLTMRAQGEVAFDLGFDVRLVRFPAESGKAALRRDARLEANSTIASTIPFHGQLIEWDRSPADSAHVDLDLASQKFDVTRQYSLRLVLNCTQNRSHECVADGDTIQTVVRVTSVTPGTDVSSEFSVTASVESMVSCANSKLRTSVVNYAGAESITIKSSTVLTVRAEALDIDGLPINYSRAQLSLILNNVPIPFLWGRGSNVYTAMTPAELTEQPGEYALVVQATNTWDEQERCVLLRCTVTVTQFDVETIIVGAVAGALLLILGVVAIYMACKHRHRAAQLFVSFLRGETLLALKILMELLDISGDSIPLPPISAPALTIQPAASC
jgi:hypothetical protein